jgi:hypothetical protein
MKNIQPFDKERNLSLSTRSFCVNVDFMLPFPCKKLFFIRTRLGIAGFSCIFAV